MIADELDRADPDEALGALSSFLAGIPVASAGEEAKPADGWRIVATWGGRPPRGAVLRRFAVVEVLGPPVDQLRAALHDAAGGDPNAAHAAERLLPLAEIAPLGAGVFLDAARHARPAARSPGRRHDARPRGVRRLRRAAARRPRPGRRAPRPRTACGVSRIPRALMALARHGEAIATARAFQERSGAQRVVLLLDRGDGEATMIDCDPTTPRSPRTT